MSKSRKQLYYCGVLKWAKNTLKIVTSTHQMRDVHRDDRELKEISSIDFLDNHLVKSIKSQRMKSF